MKAWLTAYRVGIVAQLLGLLGAVFVLALMLEWLAAGTALFGGLATLLIGGTLWRLRDRLP